MPKKCIKFISGFLIPNLDNQTFGERLKWIDRSEKKFQMSWFHKGGPKWTEQEAAVFVEWDKRKGHFQPHNKRYFTNSKQRFRALLYKLTLDGYLKNLKSEHKFIKMFCLGEGKKRKRRKSNDTLSDAECELYNEDETSSEEKDESVDDILRRTVSEDNATNVLEDHSYSSTDSNTDLGKNHNDTMDMYDVMPEFEKRVLVERNDGCEHEIPITGPININGVLETLYLQGTFRYEAENTPFTRFSGRPHEDPYFTPVSQNKPFSENSFSEFPVCTNIPDIECLALADVMNEDVDFSVSLKQEMDQNCNTY